MTVIVTGVAGFIGSRLAERLVAQGHFVRGIDRLSDYYPVDQKRRNLELLMESAQFEFIEDDLLRLDLPSLVRGASTIFHQAAQPGVRGSWRQEFDSYLKDNVLATQQLLEAAATDSSVRVVFASSSSVYGNARRFPCREEDQLRPHSPYAVTKLAAENLCQLYAANLGVSTVSLRYFTVYGGRQRPDMAIHRLFMAAVTGQPFPMFGSGAQVRDFTHVSDIVAANIAAGTAEVPVGAVINVAGGTQVSLKELIATVERITGREVPIQEFPAVPGDVDRTGGSTDRAAQWLDWTAGISLEAGLQEQWEHLKTEIGSRHG